MNNFLPTLLISVVGGLIVLAGQLVAIYLRERLPRRARREAHAEILFRERLRAYMEIFGAAGDMVGLKGRSRLAQLIIRNSLILSREAMRLSNAVLFSPEGPDKPSNEFLKSVLDLTHHLRKELTIEEIDNKELQKILRGPQHSQNQKD